MKIRIKLRPREIDFSIHESLLLTFHHSACGLVSHRLELVVVVEPAGCTLTSILPSFLVIDPLNLSWPFSAQNKGANS